MSREQLTARANTALAWAAPVILGLTLAYLWATAAWPAAFTATAAALLSGHVVWVVLDYRFLQRRLRWAELLTEYRDAAIDAGHEAARAGVYAERLSAAVLEIHRCTEPPVQGDDGTLLAPETTDYRLVLFADHMPDTHECTTELVNIPHVGWMQCDPVAHVHVIKACRACGTEWPCPTAAAVMPRTCKHCGCTDLLACDDGCSWVSEDECSACVPLIVTITADVDPFIEAMEAGSIDTLSIAGSDAGSARAGLLALLGLVAVLAGSVVLAPTPALDGRGLLAVLGGGVALAVYAAGGRRRAAR